MNQKFFKTSFGHEIPIVPNYRRGLPPPRDNTSVFGASSIEETLGAKAPKESDFGIASDIFQFAMIADWFDTTLASDHQYERMLDVGGSSGLISQLFKATGRVRAVENIEVLDFRDSLDMDLVRHYLRKIQSGRRELDSLNPFIETPAPSPSPSVLSRLRRQPASVQPSIMVPPNYTYREDQAWVVQQLNHMQSTFPYAIDRHSHYWNIDPDAPLGLDRYILGDFFKLEEQYDFLLVSTTMQHFSVPVFLKKAHSLLKPGGVILIWNAYWYWVLAINRLYADFPWGAQRLTWEDYTRYLREYQPDQVENAKLSAGVFHKDEKHYTVDDYIAAGKQAGFEHLAHHRLMPFSGVKPNIGSWQLEGDHGAAVQKEVLRDIHCFRPDVSAADLATQSVFLLFQKN